MNFKSLHLLLTMFRAGPEIAHSFHTDISSLSVYPSTLPSEILDHPSQLF